MNNDYLKVMIDCGYYVANGIEIGDTVMPFTLIDYYNLANKELYDKVDHREMKRLIYVYRIKNEVRHEYLNRFIEFLEKEIVAGEEVNNPMEILNQKYAFVYNDKRYVPTYEDVNMIMNIFDIYGVPKYERLIYQALHRVARDFPIFPLLLNEEEKKLGK